jgi:hypothetical protein
MLGNSLAPGVPWPIKTVTYFRRDLFGGCCVRRSDLIAECPWSFRLTRFVFRTKMSVHNTSSVTFGREARKGTHDTDNAAKNGTSGLISSSKVK